MTTIRRATNNDINGIVDVIKSVYDEYGFGWHPESYHADLYDIESSYDAAGDIFYVAEVDGRIAGTAALELFPMIENAFDGHLVRTVGCDCSVERLYVHPDFRRRGIARQLMDRVIADAKELGRSSMEVWSDKQFVEAHAFYKQIGARLVGDRLCDDPEQSPEYGLVLDLR